MIILHIILITKAKKKTIKLLRAYNKALIEKYPWLLPRNRWTDKVSEDYDYTYTELDDLPTGWRLAFGEDICKELQEELEKKDFAESYRILEIKEKYGGLCWYDNGNTQEGFDIIHKYELLSERVCIQCGKPAKYFSKGWINYFCPECAKTFLDKQNERMSDPLDFKQCFGEIGNKEELYFL